MSPKRHVLFSFIFISFLYFVFQVSVKNLAVVFLASTLIDLDHYLRFIVKTKSINPFKFWDWSKKQTKKFKQTPPDKLIYPIFIFHGVEFIAVIVIFTILLPKISFLIYILVGVLFHMLLDTIQAFECKTPLVKISQIYNIIRNKNLKDKFI